MNRTAKTSIGEKDAAKGQPKASQKPAKSQPEASQKPARSQPGVMIYYDTKVFGSESTYKTGRKDIKNYTHFFLQ